MAKKKTLKKAGRKATAVKAEALPAPFSTDDPHAAYTHFLPAARAVPEDHVEIINADPQILLGNVKEGVAGVAAQIERVRKELPNVDTTALLELPALALGLVFAADQVDEPASPKEIAKRLSRVGPLREAMLSQLEVLAFTGHLAAEVPVAIRKGTGPLDTARDAVRIAAVFRDNAAAFAGKHPFTDAHVASLADDGGFLVTNLRPTGAKRTAGPRSDASLVRDRFYTLVKLGHAELRKAGVVLYGEAGVDAHVPPLATRTHAARAPLPPPVPTPTPTPAPSGGAPSDNPPAT